MSKAKTIDYQVRMVQADDGSAQQRVMAGHARRTAEAWAELAASLEAFADTLDTFPKGDTGVSHDPEEAAS